MSGILALASFDERPIDPFLLEQLTVTMAFRGPDGHDCWNDDRVGLGQTSLHLGSAPAPQPTLHAHGEAVSMVADVRLDGRVELRQRLARARRTVSPDAGDATLLLHAFLAWDTEAFRQVLGDFACMIWDRRDQRLIAARDPLGVKPLYFAPWQGGLAIGNTLQTLLALPGIDQRPDDQSVADFLLFDAARSPTATPFRGIRALPPAHRQVWSPARGSSRPDGAQWALPAQRYWSFADLGDSDLPTSRFVGSDPTRDWVAAFRERLSEAVADRVRSNRVAILMSGGLDSTAVAILGHRALGAHPSPTHLGLHTVVYDPLIEDEEGHYAAIVASELSAPHRIQRFGTCELFAGWDELPSAPQLADRTLETATQAIDRALSLDARIVLTGHGGDPIQSPDVGYFLRQVRHFAWGRAWRYLRHAPRRSDRRLPPLGIGALTGIRRQRKDWRQGFPSWLAPRWVRELDLESRWHDASMERLRIETDRDRQVAAGFGTEWSTLFELMDAGARGLPISFQHPFFDLRLIALIARMPPVPWCVEKFLLRETMRDIMPDTVRLRPKRGLSTVPPLQPARRGSEIWKQWMHEQIELSSYVDVSRVLGDLEADEKGSPNGDIRYRWENRRPLNLGLWMRGLGNIGARLAPLEPGARGGGDERSAARGLEAGVPTPTNGGLR